MSRKKIPLFVETSYTIYKDSHVSEKQGSFIKRIYNKIDYMSFMSITGIKLLFTSSGVKGVSEKKYKFYKFVIFCAQFSVMSFSVIIKFLEIDSDSLHLENSKCRTMLWSFYCKRSTKNYRKGNGTITISRGVNR